ncbi:MAG: GH92 family glycosyl hydrolase [Bacteroidales bacterium]|nr:GH92 family glycosyl hydrolase [Bacteroidales bacterium]
MIKKAFLSLLATSIALATYAVSDPVEYVNTLMGTQSKFALSNGNTTPTVCVPWGMNEWIPQTGKNGDGWSYTYDADKIRGFKQTHRPSPWINDFGQYSIMPMTGGLKINEDKRASWFSHKAEVAKPYYYSVYLADYDVTTELTTTDRAASFRFTFPEDDQAYILVDAYEEGSWIKLIPEQNKIVGYNTRNSGGVGKNYANYFVVQFDRPFVDNCVWVGDNKVEGLKEIKADHVGAAVRFKTHRGEAINVTTASSFISVEQAELNLKEIGTKSFDEVKAQSKAEWNRVLGAINVESDNVDQLRTFYSCFFRALVFPHRMHEIDANGNVVHYSPFGEGSVAPGYFYTGTGFWDTFRCLFPLINLLYPEEGAKMQQGWLNYYKESGFLPEWSSPGHRGCMVGNNSASVVADGILKGLVKDEATALYEAMLYGTNHVHPQVSSTGRLGYEYYNRLGYVPYNVGIRENAARTLEYAYDDWCIYQVGKRLGRPESETDVFKQRSMNYRNLFDKESGLMRGRNADGTFQSPFNPLKWGDAFTEGNSLHYSWSVFHDVAGLIDLMGGKEAFVAKLDDVFAQPPHFDDSYYGQVIHEIREMQIMNMGNYAHGNQPIQHMIYLYNYANQPWKAQYWIRQVMNKLYMATPDGYCGDEDNGQTSAWYVFSALGFYPVCPASDQYVLGTPLFKKATINLANGKKVVINAPNNSNDNIYVKDIRFNGKAYTKNYYDYNTLLKGAVINVTMDNKPCKTRGINASDDPYSLSTAE